MCRKTIVHELQMSAIDGKGLSLSLCHWLKPQEKQHWWGSIDLPCVRYTGTKDSPV